MNRRLHCLLSVLGLLTASCDSGGADALNQKVPPDTNIADAARDVTSSGGASRDVDGGASSGIDGGAPDVPSVDRGTPSVCAQSGSGEAFPDGEGSEADPFVICTVDQFSRIGEAPESHYALGADLVFVETYDAPVVERLRGSLDGRGHAIRGLRIDSPDREIGLFRRVHEGATVRDLRLLDAVVTTEADVVGALAAYLEGEVHELELAASVEGDEFVGGIAGRGESSVPSTASGIVADVAVIGRFSSVGGLFGSAGQRIVMNAIVRGTVTGSTKVGGVTGEDQSGAYTDVSFSGELGAVEDAGGLVGATRYNLTVERVSTAGIIRSRGPMGGIAGARYDGPDGTGVRITDSYSHMGFENRPGDTSEISWAGGLTGSASNVMARSSYYAGSVSVSDVPEFRFGGLGGYGYGGFSCRDCFVAATVSVENVPTLTMAAAVEYAPPQTRLVNFHWDVDRTGISDCITRTSYQTVECIEVNSDGAMPDYWSDPDNPPMNVWDFGETGVWRLGDSGFPELR